MTDKNIMIQSVKKLLVEGKDVESILRYLRENSVSKTESMVILKESKKISLGDAKLIVHFSKTWKDMKDGDEDLNDRFLDSLSGDLEIDD